MKNSLRNDFELIYNLVKRCGCRGAPQEIKMNVYVVISAAGFILGVYLKHESAELCIRNNPQHKDCRISHEPVIVH